MPALSWLVARAAIAEMLRPVAIIFPTGITIERVFETPPKQVSDFPCIIIMGVAKAPPVRSSGLRERDYTARLRVAVDDADIHRSADILDSFTEAIIDAFDANLTVDGTVSNLIGPEWEEAQLLDAGGQNVRAVDGFVQFRMFDSPGFS